MTEDRRAERGRRPKAEHVPHIRKPEGMPLEAWQVALRREFGGKQSFRMKNIGAEPVFSEFHVTNPQTKRTYRVAIRGKGLGDNYCSCPDFSVNTLGTCKHVEFVLARLRRSSGGKAALARGFRPAYSEVYVRYGAEHEVIFSPGTGCPESIVRLARAYFDTQGALRPEAFERFHIFLKKAMAGKQELRCYNDALSLVAQVRDRAELVRRIDGKFPQGVRSRNLKNLLKIPMYSYQREGALFVAKAGRCLLADDMGLGKTVQGIAAAEILARAVGIQRVLVISPTSLKYQWKREVEKFSDRTAMVVEGSSSKRAQDFQSPSFYKMTNYDVVHRDLDLIQRWQPDLVILDEAQRIKNWKTRAAKVVKQIDSDYALVLTGTPLENRLEELHSIVEFVDRFRLGPMFRFLSEHQHLDEHGRVVGYRNLSRISETLRPILIRRTKENVLPELPERLEKRFFVPMTDEQMTHHEENREIVGRVVQKWRRHGYLSEVDQRRLTCALQNMRMACNSTYLLDRRTDHGFKADELVALLTDTLEEPDAKAVVFSQWVRTHELIVRRLARRSWQHVLFHGSVPGPQRKQLIRRFHEDKACRLFLSTDAGGVGLNLQNANVVINMDQPWNPAVLEQRIGRVHRLGQRRPVRVVHFIAKGTIEEGMLGLLSFKKSVFTGVLDGGKDEVFLGGTRLNRFMETVDKVVVSIPQPAPESEAVPVPDQPTRTAGATTPLSATASVDRNTVNQQLLAELLTAGASWLGQIGQALSTPSLDASSTTGHNHASFGIARDQSDGRPYLRLPLPDPDTLGRVTAILAAFSKPAST